MTTEPDSQGASDAADQNADQDSADGEPLATVTTRRALLASSVLLLAAPIAARAASFPGGDGLPWRPFAGNAPQPATTVQWVFFTPEEAAAVEALVDRLIPPDPDTPGGKDCGCAVFIDRQLAGAYGTASGLYMSGPFAAGTPQQGLQDALAPAEFYRGMLAALDQYCRATFAGKPFAELADNDKDTIIGGLEKRTLQLPGVKAAAFFPVLLQDTRQGFFADPVYGGNRDMAAWKMIGFPGARYDYRDWIQRHNERYPHPPVSIAGT